MRMVALSAPLQPAWLVVAFKFVGTTSFLVIGRTTAEICLSDTVIALVEQKDVARGCNDG